MKIKTIPAYSGNTSLMPIPTCELRNHHCPRGEHFHLRLSYMTNVPFLNSSSIFNSPSSLSLSSTFWELSFNLMHPRFSEISILIFSSFFLSFIQLLGIYIIIVPPIFCITHSKILLYIICWLPESVQKSFPIANFNSAFRITTTYARNTYSVLHFVSFLKVHPRLRGEHWQSRFESSFKKGSPPPTRGTLLSLFFSASFFGITPAYAGNTACARCLIV